MFSLVSLSKSKVFRKCCTRVVRVVLVLHTCCSCLTRVTLVSHSVTLPIMIRSSEDSLFTNSWAEFFLWFFTVSIVKLIKFDNCSGNV